MIHAFLSFIRPQSKESPLLKRKDNDKHINLRMIKFHILQSKIIALKDYYLEDNHITFNYGFV